MYGTCTCTSTSYYVRLFDEIARKKVEWIAQLEVELITCIKCIIFEDDEIQEVLLLKATTSHLGFCLTCRMTTLKAMVRHCSLGSRINRCRSLWNNDVNNVKQRSNDALCITHMYTLTTPKTSITVFVVSVTKADYCASTCTEVSDHIAYYEIL